jgi:chemotaxis-related protein WspB
MLALTFQIGTERLALDIRHVREVVPRVHLRTLSGAPAWLAGVFVYRGDVVPVIDLHRLADAGECPPHLSSRIILIASPLASPRDASLKADRLIGLLATQVDVARALTPAGQPVPSLRDTEHADLGPVYATDQGVFRFVALELLLPQSSWRQLLHDSSAGASPSPIVEWPLTPFPSPSGRGVRGEGNGVKEAGP